MKPHLSTDHQLPIRQRPDELMSSFLSSDTLVPAFSDAAVKLCSLSQKETTSLDELAAVISLDPGLATRCLKVASSIGFAARPIDNIDQAVLLIGIRQVRRIAFAAATIDALGKFQEHVDWRAFWLHNILVARLADRTAAYFRSANGMEYLSGLLHDVGKLILNHYYPQQFAEVLALVAERKCPHFEAELAVLNIDHSRVGGVICTRMQIHPHVISAVRYHHDPRNKEHISDPASDGGFLAACVAVADRLANQAAGIVHPPPLEKTLEWNFLSRLAGPKGFTVDLPAELQSAEQDLQALLA